MNRLQMIKAPTIATSAIGAATKITGIPPSSGPSGDPVVETTTVRTVETFPATESATVRFTV